MAWLPRVQWFEFHEQHWMPSSLRHAITRSITFDMWFLGCFRGELLRRFARWLERTGADQVLDIGSGAGGPVLALVRGLLRDGIEPPRFFLSDLYPDVGRYAAVSDRTPVWGDGDSRFVSFVHDPVDALAEPLAVDQRFFTLVNITHHFPPALLKRILGNLVRQGRGVFIIESFYRSLRFFPLMVASLLPSWLAPLMLRPFSWPHLVFGTVVPLVPLLMAHDGLATVLRSYNPDEWRALVAELPAEGYEWEIDRMRTGTVYVAGWRR